MRYFRLLAALLLGFVPGFACAQTNTFPASGDVGIGTTTPTALLDLYGSGAFEQIDTTGDAFGATRWSNNVNGPYFYISKSRSGTIGTYSAVDQNDVLGGFLFRGDGGSNLENAAQIEADVDGSGRN